MLTKIICLVSFLSLFLSSVPAHSAVFNVSSGDVTGLIAAIGAANSNGEENTINLEAGTYRLTVVYSLSVPTVGGANGLPTITSQIRINGDRAATTAIERDTGAPGFRIFDIASSGNLTINRLTIRGGSVGAGPGSVIPGGGIKNAGSLIVTESLLEKNFAEVGGGIHNTGTANVSGTIIRDNRAQLQGSAIFNGGIATISNSSLIDGRVDFPNGAVWSGSGAIMTFKDSTISGNTGGGIVNWGTLAVKNSSIANNVSYGISNRGTLTLANTTVSGNFVIGTGDSPITAGIRNEGGVAELRSSILALNRSVTPPPDCMGPITSLGNNIIGDPTGCDITLQPSDLTGDPGLDAFIDDGAPGGGRFPLLSGSPAINAGNDSACPVTDQLDTPRLGRCDIGAVEFYPIINDLVAVGNVSTEFDPTPVPNGPAGTFRITAEFTNTSTQPIGHRFAEVIELAEGNLVLNADRGAGRVGARLTRDNTSTPLLPGATETFEFIIGLQKEEPFTFFVNLLGDPEVSNISVTRLEKQ